METALSRKRQFENTVAGRLLQKGDVKADKMYLLNFVFLGRLSSCKMRLQDTAFSLQI